MMDEHEWYAQTWAGQRDALIVKATEMVDTLAPASDHPEVAEAIRLLTDLTDRLRNASATPSVDDITRILRNINASYWIRSN